MMLLLYTDSGIGGAQLFLYGRSSAKGSLLRGFDCHFRRCTGSHAVFEKTGADENMQRVAAAIFIAVCAALFRGMGSACPFGCDGSAGIFPMWLYRND